MRFAALAAALTAVACPGAYGIECLGPNLSEEQILGFFRAELAKRRTTLPPGSIVKVGQDKCDYVVSAEGPSAQRGPHLMYWLDRTGRVKRVFARGGR